MSDAAGAENSRTTVGLQARYPQALEFRYDSFAIVNGAIRPGECAANVFDFEDGLRLIVNRELLDGCVHVLHVSEFVLEVVKKLLEGTKS